MKTKRLKYSGVKWGRFVILTLGTSNLLKLPNLKVSRCGIDYKQHINVMPT
jgi:hypothetical protein